MKEVFPTATVIVGKGVDAINAIEFLSAKGISRSDALWIVPKTNDINIKCLIAFLKKDNLRLSYIPYPRVMYRKQTLAKTNYRSRVADAFAMLLRPFVQRVWWFLAYVTSGVIIRLKSTARTKYFIGSPHAVHLFVLPWIKPVRQIVITDEGSSTVNSNLLQTTFDHGVEALVSRAVRIKSSGMPSFIRRSVLKLDYSNAIFFTAYAVPSDQNHNHIRHNTHNVLKERLLKKPVDENRILVLGDIKSGSAVSKLSGLLLLLRISGWLTTKTKFEYKPHPREKLTEDVIAYLKANHGSQLADRKSVELFLLDLEDLPSLIISWESTAHQVLSNAMPNTVRVASVTDRFGEDYVRLIRMRGPRKSQLEG